MTTDNDDGLDIPEFLKISPERRKQAWVEYDKAKALRATSATMAQGPQGSAGVGTTSEGGKKSKAERRREVKARAFQAGLEAGDKIFNEIVKPAFEKFQLSKHVESSEQKH